MIEIINLSKKYGELAVFEKFNLEIEESEITCILGRSGCGKSTLLNIIAGLIPFDKGEIKGVDYNRISYIFQDPRLLPWLTALENVKLVLLSLEEPKIAEKTAARYLEMVGLKEYYDFYPHQLSGGMKQRVAIARAFAYPSDLLLMDEPFKGLDIELKENLISSFLDIWAKQKKTVVFVTHEIEDAEKIGHKLINISNLT